MSIGELVAVLEIDTKPLVRSLKKAGKVLRRLAISMRPRKSKGWRRHIRRMKAEARRGKS